LSWRRNYTLRGIDLLPPGNANLPIGVLPDAT
jgi:hypothetical protein